MESMDMTKENVQKIAALFPNCVTEHKDKQGNIVLGIDFEKLKIELGEDIIGENEERYQFTWPDKKQAIREANNSTTNTLRPYPEESVDFENTKNLYIEGDNLEVLKCLRETYLGKVKMIYIDPPYNTGNDFVYNDDFSSDEREYKDNSGQKDSEGNRLFKNTESNGRFHTDWLNMMYARLKVAKDLLSDEGVIFISIDDHEVENLRNLSNEIFGKSNFVGMVTVKGNPRGRQSSSYVAQVHDYLLIYRKSDSLTMYGFKIGEEEINKRFNKSDENGTYEEWELRKRGAGSKRIDVPSLYFPIYYNISTNQISTVMSEGFDVVITPKLSDGTDGRWRWSQQKIENEKGRLYVRKNSKGVYNVYERKTLEEKNTQLAPTIWDFPEVNTELGTKLVKKLFNGKGYFDYPKPIGLIKRILSLINDENSLILDFFSGSATTAHAVFDFNRENNSRMRFIMVQLQEQTSDGSEAKNDGYNTICDIAKDRIRIAGKKIKEESPDSTKDLDTGFRVLKLDSSNMEDVYYTPFETNQNLFKDQNIKEGRSDLDLLFQVMLESNVELSEKIETKKIEGKNVYFVKDYYLVACFDVNVTEKVITAVAKEKPFYFVLRDSSLASDNVADNFEQIFRTYSPETIRRIL